MKEYVEKSITYEEYVELIDRLLAEGKTTGPNQSESMFEYARLNRQRIRRLEKTVEIDESLAARLRDNDRKMIWLIITEGWCGDAAQNIPAIEKIAAVSPLIETRYVLRDENLDLMDAFLTNNARSIPKLIALDAGSFAVLGTWGPRPLAAMEYFAGLRDAGKPKDEINELLQRWYNADRSRSIHDEFAALLSEWSAKSSTAAPNR